MVLNAGRAWTFISRDMMGKLSPAMTSEQQWLMPMKQASLDWKHGRVILTSPLTLHLQSLTSNQLLEPEHAAQ